MRQLFNTIGLLVVAAMFAGAGQCAALDLGRQVSFSIPAQRLDAALVAFSRQAQLQVVTAGAEVNDLDSAGVSGKVSIGDALAQLLGRSGLAYKAIGDSAISIGKFQVAGEGWDTRVAQAETASPSSAAGEGAPNSADEEKSGIQEIVVTARKRSESLQDVPMAVSAIQGTELSKKGIDSVENLYGRIPNLFSVAGGASEGSDSIFLVIRGVGFNGGQEPATGVFIDGVFQPQIGYDVGFLDLERVEVLRGPQGTLYGRNTQAGALNIVTKKPRDIFEGSVEFEVAEFDTYRGRASLSGPLAGNFFGGIAAEHGRTDGYVNNLIPGERGKYDERDTVRGALRWLPAEGLEINLSGDFSQKRFNDMSEGVPLSCRCYDVREDVVEDEKELYGTALTINWAASDSMSLTSITGWRAVDSDITADLDLINSPGASELIPGIPGSVLSPDPVLVFGNDYQTKFEQRILSQELRLAGQAGSGIDWQLGAYYFEQTENFERQWFSGPDIAQDPVLEGFAPLYAFQDVNQDRNGWASFGQVSWKPRERLELTLGGRYARETAKQYGGNNANVPQIGYVYELDVGSRKDRHSRFTSMGSIAYGITEHMKTYFTVSQGWKAGGYNKFPDADASAKYDDENSLNYELGVKSSWLDGRIQVNSALFYVDITDQQLSGIIFVDDIPLTFIGNAGKSKSKGVEFEMDARVTDRLTLSGSLGYADSRFIRFLDGSGGPPGVVRDGERFPFVPDLTGSAALEYRVPVSDAMDLGFLADYTYIASYIDENASLAGRLSPNYIVPSQGRTNVQVSLRTDSGWTVAAYARNVFDSYDISTTTLLENFYTLPYLYASALPPRQIGLKVSKEF